MLYDLLVVGAGPAGSEAARHAASSGLTVLLIDKDVFPRSKPCGGALSLSTVAALGDLPEQFLENECRGVVAHVGSRTRELDARPVAYFTTRKKLDSFLLARAKQAGAEVITGVRAGNLKVLADQVRIRAGEQEFRAQMVIGADGAASIVSSEVRPKFDPQRVHSSQAAVVPAPSDLTAQFAGKAHIFFDLVQEGYGWIFPQKDALAVGIASRKNRGRELKDAYQAMMDQAGLGSLEQDVKPHLIPYAPLGTPVFAPRILLAGDAAGFTDPFLGEGISYALLSGRFAAEAAVRALRSGSFQESFSWYKQKCESCFWRNLEYAEQAARVLYHLPALLRNRLLLNPRVAAEYLKVLSGEKRYSDFWKGLAKTAAAQPTPLGEK